MYIPDCRTDEFYNVDKLNEKDRTEIAGYDWCAEEVVDNFFDNLDVCFDDDSVLMETLGKEVPASLQTEYEMEDSFDGQKETRVVKTYADLLRMSILDHIERNRDEVIVSMIDNAMGGTMGD